MSVITLPNKEFLAYVSQQLNQDKRVIMTVVGSSMEPFFKDKKTHVTLIKDNTYNTLDVILFKIDEKFFLHRIINIKHNIYYCQGDHTFTYEKPEYKDIIGKVITFETKNKIYSSQSVMYKMKVLLWLRIKPVFKVLKKIMRKMS